MPGGSSAPLAAVCSSHVRASAVAIASETRARVPLLGSAALKTLFEESGETLCTQAGKYAYPIEVEHCGRLGQLAERAEPEAAGAEGALAAAAQRLHKGLVVETVLEDGGPAEIQKTRPDLLVRVEPKLLT